MAEEEGKVIQWPGGADEATDFDFLMVGKNNKPIMKIPKEKLNEVLVLNGEGVKAVAGGASSSSPTILRPGPAGQNRKMEKVKGWFVNGTSAEPPVATGTPWEAPEDFDNTNWWDGTAKVWSLGSSVPLPMQQGVTIINPTGSGLPTEKATADYVQPLFDNISILEDKIDELTENKSALIIDNTSATIGSDTTNNPKNEIIVTSTLNNTIYGDFTVWGTSKFFPATVKYTDGTYANVLIVSFTNSSATASNNFPKNVERISNLHDATLGQHLSDLGYKDMGNRLYNSDYRHSFRSNLIKGINMSTHSINNGVVTDNSTNTKVLTLRTLNGYPSNYTGIGPASVSYVDINTPRMNMYPTNIVGRGIEFDFDSNYNGFFEIFIGTRITGTQSVGGVDVDLVGGVQIQFINRSNSNVIYEKFIKGETKRVLFDHDKGNFTVKIFLPTAEYTSAIISQMYWWKKRVISPPRKIFNNSDRILFLTDSWGMYPQETDPNFQVQMFDGYKINGRCYMTLEFKSRFVANGGDPNNVILATRGGMTTVWAKYWIDHIVNIVKPTKVVLHFGINDLNSISKHSNPENEYKFDPTNIWGTKNISDGGIVGSIPDIATYKANINELRSYCIAKGIIPVFFTPPKTASSAQAQALANMARDVFFAGLK